MTVVVRRPGPPLDALIPAITYQAGDQPRTSVEKILPDPAAGLWVNLNQDEFRSFSDGRAASVPGSMFAGPRGRASVIEFEQGRSHVWVAFGTGAAAAFGLPPQPAADELAPLSAFWGGRGNLLRERLLSAGSPDHMLREMESVLLGQLRESAAPDPAMLAAARLLSGGRPVAEVADDLGLLPRTLRRRFAAGLGLAPKRFARVQRLRRVVRAVGGREQADWAALAAAYGYSDQPHLIDEFRAIAGLTPGEYLRSRIDINGPAHLRVTGSARAR